MKKEKKKTSIELQKPNVEAEVYNNNKKCDWIYTHTYTPISKIKTVQQQQQQKTINWPSKQRKPKIIPTKTKLTKAQTWKQRCQLVNKAMKTKLTNMLRRKERNKRKK